jgi:hypothetical protein
MKSKIILMIVGFCLFGSWSFTYGQTGATDKIQRSFVKTIDNELKRLKSLALNVKQNPETELKYIGNTWRVSYSDFSNKYSYDIRKTDSITSPYMGVVTFYFQFYVKEGKTREECLRAPWRLWLDQQRLVYIYAFQGGKWGFKDSQTPDLDELIRRH